MTARTESVSRHTLPFPLIPGPRLQGLRLGNPHERPPFWDGVGQSPR